MRRDFLLPTILAVFGIALSGFAGCDSSEDEATPHACLDGVEPYRQALADAPRPVRLDGETPISACLAPQQSVGELANLGTILVALTTRLNAEARADPLGASTIQLGYLIGAVDRGAAETGGIHAELARRLEAAALFSPGGKPPPRGLDPFDRTYRSGYAAGREDG